MYKSQTLWDKYTIDNLDDKNDFKYYIMDYINFHANGSENIKKVCEIGCNVGNNLELFYNEGYDITGIDFNQKALDIAKSKMPNANFILADITSDDFKLDNYDLIFTRGVLIHIKDRKDICKLVSKIHNSARYIVHCEYLGFDGKMIPWSRGNDLLWYRNMCEYYDLLYIVDIRDLKNTYEMTIYFIDTEQY